MAKIIGPRSNKWYKCRGCGYEHATTTNHWGAIYPMCKGCGKLTVSDCTEQIPDDYEKPEEWKIVKLGDVCTITPGVTIR